MKLIQKVLLLFAALLLPLLCTACSTESDEVKYLALLEDVYGEDFVVKLPQQEGYGVLVPYSFPDNLYPGNDGDSLVAVPLENLAGNEWHFNKQFEEYSGNDIVLTSTETSFKKGSEITLTLSNNRPNPSDAIVHSWGVHIEINVDGHWKYVGCTEPPGLTAPEDIRPGTGYTITLDSSSLNNKRLYKYNEETNDYYAKYPTARDIILPEGKYRITKIIDRPELCSLTCEFEIVE